MISDLRAKLRSSLGLDPATKDNHILTAVDNLIRQRNTYRDLLARSRTAVRKPWAAVDIGDMVVARDGDVWTVHDRIPGEGEDTDITFKVTSPSGETKGWPMRPSDEVNVFEHSPITGAFEVLQEALDVQWKGVGR